MSKIVVTGGCGYIGYRLEMGMQVAKQVKYLTLDENTQIRTGSNFWASGRS